MSTLPERVRWVIESGRVENARKWSLKAGLSPKLVSTFLDRSASNPNADMTRGTVEHLARAADVRAEWLASGIDPRSVARPNRDTAIAQLRSSGMSERDVAFLHGIAPPDGEADASVKWWLECALGTRFVPEQEALPAATPAGKRRDPGWRKQISSRDVLKFAHVLGEHRAKMLADEPARSDTALEVVDIVGRFAERGVLDWPAFDARIEPYRCAVEQLTSLLASVDNSAFQAAVRDALCVAAVVVADEYVRIAEA